MIADVRAPRAIEGIDDIGVGPSVSPNTSAAWFGVMRLPSSIVSTRSRRIPEGFPLASWRASGRFGATGSCMGVCAQRVGKNLWAEDG